MYIVGIRDRIQGAWALCAPTANDLCIQLCKLEEDKDTISYLINDFHGNHIKSISESFGWRDEQFGKFTK